MEDEIMSPDVVDTGSDEGNTGIEDTSEPDYTPNYSFRVREEDHEFDDWVRPAITSAEHENKLRELYTKAYGLDSVKSRADEYERKYSETNEKYGTLNSQWENMSNGLQKINDMKEKDFGTFRKVWQIPDHKILEAASEIMQYMQNPELKAQYDANQDRALQMLQQEQSLTQHSQQTAQMQRQMHDMKMQQVYGDPEISRFEKEFDKRMGKPGSFRDEVNSYGSLQFHNGKYVEPSVVVSTVYSRMKNLLGDMAVAQAQQQAAPQAQSVRSLPNMGSGKTGSAVKKKITSTDDLRKLAASLG
jgi:hypothetical protein